jgi:hypothetical protein
MEWDQHASARNRTSQAAHHAAHQAAEIVHPIASMAIAQA